MSVYWKSLAAAFFLSSLLLLQLPAASLAEVVELDVYNFASTIQAFDYTCVLFYDSLDIDGAEEYKQVLQALEDHNQSISVARLDIRHHQYVRHLYKDEPGEDEFAKEYYDDFSSDDPNDALVLHPELFMNMALGTIYWPLSLKIIGRDFNVYSDLDLRVITGSTLLKIAVVERWYKIKTLEPLDEASPRILSMANQELAALKQNKHADNSFDFDAYHEMQQEKEEEEEEEEESEDSTPKATDIRLLLETDSVDDGKVSSRGHFTHKRFTAKKSKTSYSYLSTFSTLLDRYFAWVEGYEFSWSPQRKQREDEQLNFGVYLNQMNQQLVDLVHRIFNPALHQKRLEEWQMKFDHNPEQLKKIELPNLKKYIDEMIFGYGRLPSDWKETLANMADTLGKTPAERRRNRLNFNGTEFPMIQRMREYMDVFAKVHDDDELYSVILADLVSNWHNIMREFSDNLNKYYLEQYLPSHPRPHGNEFQFQTMDVLDMNSEESRHMLTQYDDFHKKYTEAGIPVILSNVVMSRQNVTLDYLVETCAASDVTRSVKLSHKVGKRQSGSGWGGLSDFILPGALATGSRYTVRSKSKASSDDSDDSDDDDSSDDDTEVVSIDRDLTMEQFVILHNEIDTLYLHDYTLVENCDRLLYNDIVYDDPEAWKFRIPSVIANYDLFQRAMFTGYERSWPSLFVGRKGSNSKLHLDSGATGFFMYLVSGRKRWIVYNRDEQPFIYEKLEEHAVYPDILGSGKNEESNEFLSNRFPLLHRAAEGGYEIIQEPGQLIYIPPNCPHAVENLEDIVGIAMNIVPREGIANHFHTLIHSDMEFDRFNVAMEYVLFDDNAEHPMQTKDPLYATFAEYKGQL